MTATSLEIHGHCDPKFRRVQDAFIANFEDRGDHGASVCVTIGGETVVDLWAGWMDIPRTRPWERDTIANLWSSTKGMAAVAGHVAADQGLLDFEAPVAQYWPEFAQNGKEHVPVKWLFSHQVGLVDFDGEHPDRIALDWDAVCARLAATKPQWEPGTQCGYHATTWGWLVGEVVRRAAGAKTFGQYFKQVVADPLGADFWIGLPDSEHDRVARIFRERPDPNASLPPPTLGGAGDEIAQRIGLLGIEKYSASPASPEWKRAELPAMNGHGNARSLARVYAAMANGGAVDGVRLMSPQSVERAATVQYEGEDRNNGGHVIRTLGFQKPATSDDPRPREAFGHGGMGGSLGFADPVNRLSFGYAMNMMSFAGGPVDNRADDLARAVYQSL